MSNFNFKTSDFDDPNKVAEAISGPNSERNLRTSRSVAGNGDPRDVTLFSMSQILMGIPAMKTGEEILAGIQGQVFSGLGVIGGALEGVGLGGLLPGDVRSAIGVSTGPSGPAQPFSIYGPDGEVPPFDGSYSPESTESIQKTVATADADVGYQEEPPGSNNQKFAAIAQVTEGQSWCSTFLMAVFKMAGFDQGNLLTPSTRQSFSNYQEVGRTGDTPVVGAIVFFAYGGDTINHNGLVVGVNGNEIETIEGNTSVPDSGSQREGIAVARKKRSSNIKGYAYPVYPGEPGISLPQPAGAPGSYDPGAPPPGGGASGGSGISYRWHPAQGASVDSKGPRPGASALMKVVNAYFPGTGNLGIYNYRKIRGGSSLSVHSEGRALDISVPVTPEGKALGDRVFHVIASAAWPLGLQRIVWYRRIWQASNPAGKAYGGDHPHEDHLHVEMTREAATNLGETQVHSIVGSYLNGQSYNAPAGT